MTIVKTHTGTVITRDGPKVKKLHQTERMWVVGKNEFYHKETGRRHFAENTRRRLLLDTIKPIEVSMFKQNEKAISQIAEYIPRACRGMQLQEAKARLEKKIALYTDDGCDAAVLNAAFAPALNSHTRESFFSCIAEQLHEGADK